MPAERQPVRQQRKNKAPELKIKQAQVISENKVRTSKHNIQYDDCACSLI